MKVVHGAEIFAAFRGMGRPGLPLITNFFYLSEAELSPAVASEPSFGLHGANIAYFLAFAAGFYRLFYATCRRESLVETLPEAIRTARPPIVADLIGRPQDIEPSADLFAAAGFQRYAYYQRMCLLKPPDAVPRQPAGPQPVVWVTTPAILADTLEIHRLIAMHFDEHAEHLPAREEVEGAIRARTILVVRRGAAIAALLYYDRVGVTSTLRYWFVSSDFRGEGLGAGLIRRHFHDCHEQRRFLLWVDTANCNAIARYQHYGYTSDGVFDRIMRVPGAKL